MFTIIQQVLILVLFGLFTIGLGSTVRLLLLRSANGHASYNRSFHLETWEGLSLIVGLLSYAIICNALLIIPGLFELIGLPNSWMPGLHKASLAVCLAIALALALIGALAVLCQRGGGADSFWLRLPIPPPTKRALVTLGISGGAYLILAQLNTNSYDLGLYHYPYVNHLVQFGPELGLAHLHARFGFYNVQLFGQAPWQALCKLGTLSPSLNIVFFSGFLLHFFEAIVPSSVEGSRRSLSPLLLSVLGIVVGIYNFGSLSGFDADFSLSLFSLMLIDGFYRWKNTQDRLTLIPLLLLAPLLKQSGLLIIAVSLAFLILEYALKHTFKASADLDPRYSSAEKTSIQPLRTISFISTKQARTVLTLVLAAWLCMAATNIIQSGYPLFPRTTLGPIGSHAVSREGAISLSDRSILAYARFNDDNSDRVVTKAPLSLWLKPFLLSDRGQQMITWISAAFFASLLCLIYYFLWNRSLWLARLSVLSMSTLLTLLTTLLVLPPNPRFFAWLGALAFFVALETLRIRPLLGLLMACVATAALAARGQRSLLISVGAPPFSTDNKPRAALHGWRPRQDGEAFMLHRPQQGDQCWAVPAPCSPYRAGLDDPKAKNLLLLP
jgi:hypothetical protein